MLISPYSYVFNDFSKITNVSYSPQLDNLKNDFTIWGERQGAAQKLPIHVRYAIDKKPTQYISPFRKNESSEENLIWDISDWDWREIIYQMAIDYFKHSHEDDFYWLIAKYNP
jgi:hypothetical protein